MQITRNGTKITQTTQATTTNGTHVDIPDPVLTLVQAMYRPEYGMKVQAIKFVRAHFSLDLRDAKEVCDALYELYQGQHIDQVNQQLGEHDEKSFKTQEALGAPRAAMRSANLK